MQEKLDTSEVMNKTSNNNMQLLIDSHRNVYMFAVNETFMMTSEYFFHISLVNILRN